MGQKAYMVAVPTTSGTGSEVTSFAVITDDATGVKYPIADYALTPNMAIVDANLVLSMPKGLCAAGGIDALVIRWKPLPRPWRPNIQTAWLLKPSA